MQTVQHLPIKWDCIKHLSVTLYCCFAIAKIRAIFGSTKYFQQKIDFFFIFLLKRRFSALKTDFSRDLALFYRINSGKISKQKLMQFKGAPLYFYRLEP